MNIEKFAHTPKLIEVILDDENLVEEYGEPITFYAYDIVSMNIYFDFFNLRSNSEFENLHKLIKTMILNDKGEPVLTENKDLPMDIMTSAIVKIGEILGKSLGKKSTQTTGKAQK